MIGYDEFYVIYDVNEYPPRPLRDMEGQIRFFSNIKDANEAVEKKIRLVTGGFFKSKEDYIETYRKMYNKDPPKHKIDTVIRKKPNLVIKKVPSEEIAESIKQRNESRERMREVMDDWKENKEERREQFQQKKKRKISQIKQLNDELDELKDGSENLTPNDIERSHENIAFFIENPLSAAKNLRKKKSSKTKPKRKVVKKVVKKCKCKK